MSFTLLTLSCFVENIGFTAGVFDFCKDDYIEQCISNIEFSTLQLQNDRGPT